MNREQRRYFQKKQYQKYGYWMVALDRTQWKGRNIFMVTLVWGTHALPIYWETLNHVRNSNLQTQKRLIKTAIKLLKKCRIVVLADREFHSPKLAKWLDEKGVYFALRQKKNLYFQEKYEQEYKVLKNQGFKPGKSHLPDSGMTPYLPTMTRLGFGRSKLEDAIRHPLWGDTWR